MLLLIDPPEANRHRSKPSRKTLFEEASIVPPKVTTAQLAASFPITMPLVPELMLELPVNTASPFVTITMLL